MSRVLSGDLERLVTGTSERFRQRCRGKSGAEGHVQHTIAPQRAKMGKVEGQMFQKLPIKGESLLRRGRPSKPAARAWPPTAISITSMKSGL